jgi:hypothetical protein
MLGGRSVVVPLAPGGVGVCSASSGELLLRLDGSGSAHIAACSPDTTEIFVGFDDGKSRLYDNRSGQRLCE